MTAAAELYVGEDNMIKKLKKEKKGTDLFLSARMVA
jgi:hypothetical protein